MYIPSYSFLLSGIFIGYISYSIYTISLLFKPPPCVNQRTCVQSYLSKHPKLQLNLFTSTMRDPFKKDLVNKVYTDKDYNYDQEKEM